MFVYGLQMYPLLLLACHEIQFFIKKKHMPPKNLYGRDCALVGPWSRVAAPKDWPRGAPPVKYVTRLWWVWQLSLLTQKWIPLKPNSNMQSIICLLLQIRNLQHAHEKCSYYYAVSALLKVSNHILWMFCMKEKPHILCGMDPGTPSLKCSPFTHITTDGPLPLVELALYLSVSPSEYVTL